MSTSRQSCRSSAVARLLGLPVRIPLEGLDVRRIFLCVVLVVASSVVCSEDYYRLRVSNCGWSGISKRGGRGPFWAAARQILLPQSHISKCICLIVDWYFGLQNLAITGSYTLKRWSSSKWKLTEWTEKTKLAIGEFWNFRTCCNRESLSSGILRCISSNWKPTFYVRHNHHLQWVKYFGTFRP